MVNKLAFPLLILAALSGGPLLAEFRCGSELSYQWQKAGQDAAAKVLVGSFQATGVDEPAAKAALATRLEREKISSREQCKKEHENLSGCYSVKFASMAALIQSLDFAARKSLSEAITSDCKQQQGSCLDVKSSDPICQDLAAAAAKTPEAESGKKEEKGKKKK
jgi:hypothetical protein